LVDHVLESASPLEEISEDRGAQALRCFFIDSEILLGYSVVEKLLKLVAESVTIVADVSFGVVEKLQRGMFQPLR
jgi:hypothetical protein